MIVRRFSAWVWHSGSPDRPKRQQSSPVNGRRPRVHRRRDFRIALYEAFRLLRTLPLEYGLFDLPQAAHYLFRI